MDKKYCSVCLSGELSEDAPVLAISGYGVPRCLCDRCAEKIDIMTYGKDCGEIREAIGAIAAIVSEKSIDDQCVYDAVSEVINYAKDRADKIKDGSWDFELDKSEEEVTELPEELLESEEDKLLDKKEAEANKKLDKIMNWVYLGAILATVAFAVYYLFFK